jgi:(E)-4-hydroxy-3-methylbut-2-enyl-diphosphate synthase
MISPVPTPAYLIANQVLRLTMLLQRKDTIPVMVGGVQVGGGAPVVVQSMTNTDTEDALSTATQCIELAEAGSELVRITVNTPRAAECVPEIVSRVRDAGVSAPIIGDFHYNGHRLLTKVPGCAQALDKYRINPGNVGKGEKRDEQFATICKVAVDNNKPVRIGVNMGSLNSELIMEKMQENTDRDLGKSADEIMNECMIISALESTALAIECGLRPDQIIISVKTSTPRYLIQLYEELATKTRQPLHLGLTEAGMGMKGQIWSAAALAVLLEQGIGDTIRVSLTPRPGGDRREEVYACQEVLQSLGLRQFAPSITACPGCGRTTSTTFQELASETLAYVRERMPYWRANHAGVEGLKVAVMGCIVNGPGESKAANIGISLPGNGEDPVCPVFVDGEHHANYTGTKEQLASQFRVLLEDYVTRTYAGEKALL